MTAVWRWARITIISGVGLLSATACQAQDNFSSKPVPLYIDEADLNQIDQLEFMGGLELDGPADFGGLSDFVVDENNHLLAITDQGRWFETDLIFDPAGFLQQISNSKISHMLDEKGRVLRDKRHGDAESLTRLANQYLVGFELRHRLWLYPGAPEIATSMPKKVSLPSPLRDAPSNGGLEAMTKLADGQVLLFTEQLTDLNGNRVGRVLDQDLADLGPIYLTPERDFQPTGLTSLSNGDVLLLERSYRPQTGVRLRISRLAKDLIKIGQVLEREEIARLEGMMNIDNFEGIAQQPLPDGSIRILILSDDNFNPLQRTLLLTFRYTPQ